MPLTFLNDSVAWKAQSEAVLNISVALTKNPE